MHLHAIPPHKVQKSPPLNVQSYTLRGGDHHKVTLGESPARSRDNTVARGRPSAPRYRTAWHRMRRGESDEPARGTVTAVAFRGPHPCLSPASWTQIFIYGESRRIMQDIVVR